MGGMTRTSLAVLAALVLGAPDIIAAGQAPLIQNSRVIVWDVAPGTQAPATTPSHDVVTFVIRGDQAKVQTEVLYRVKGAVSEPPPTSTRRIVIELQDAAVPPLANTSGYPLAFPRPGSRKLFENERVVVWSFTWTPGVATPMHFHDKDVVVTYLAEGALTSTDLQGKAVVNEHHFGYTKFNARDRVHTETLARGQGSALMVELK
jgi:redox-sensitive bicupin YhaK (pirin superfamily)